MMVWFSSTLADGPLLLALWFAAVFGGIEGGHVVAAMGVGHLGSRRATAGRVAERRTP